MDNDFRTEQMEPREQQPPGLYNQINMTGVENTKASSVGQSDNKVQKLGLPKLQIETISQGDSDQAQRLKHSVAEKSQSQSRKPVDTSSAAKGGDDQSNSQQRDAQKSKPREQSTQQSCGENPGQDFCYLPYRYPDGYQPPKDYYLRDWRQEWPPYQRRGEERQESNRTPDRKSDVRNPSGLNSEQLLELLRRTSIKS